MGWIKQISKARTRHQCAICGEAILIGAKYENNQNESNRYDKYGICLTCREYIKFHKEMNDHCVRHGIEPYTELQKWTEKYKNSEIKTEGDRMLVENGYEKVEDDWFFTMFQRKEEIVNGKDYRIVTLFFDKKQLMLHIYAILYDKQNHYCTDYSDYFLEAETIKGIYQKMYELENDKDRWVYKRGEEENGGE